jgi:hypothetical protein
MCRILTRHNQIHRTSGPGSLKTIEQIRRTAFLKQAVGHHIHAKIVISIKRDAQNLTRVIQNALKSGHTVYVASKRIECDIKLTINPRRRVEINNIAIKKIWHNQRLHDSIIS